MNNLSWLIYVADTIPELTSGIAFFSVGVLICCFAPCFISFMEDRECKDKILKITKRVAIFTVLALIINGITPSKTTILMIAGSEAAESVVASKEGAEVLRDLKTIIKNRIKKELR